VTELARQPTGTGTTILVTGATGRVGGRVVARLTEAGVTVRALSRNPGSDVVGDLSEPDSLKSAVDGVDAVFLVFPSVAADESAAELINVLADHTGRIVYLSAHGVPEPPAGTATPDGGIIGSHAYLESLIARSGMAWTFLRSSGFAANTLMWADQLRSGNVLRWFHGGAKRALVHEDDLAAVGVRALLADGHDRARYHLTGPQQLTQVEQLEAIGAALGRPLRFAELDPETAGAELFAGAPAELARGIIDAHGAMVRNPEPMTDTVERLTGRPAKSFARWASDHADDFG
jgi:uncharacterized protein YbjT (DUF2867 family)